MLREESLRYIRAVAEEFGAARVFFYSVPVSLSLRIMRTTLIWR